VKSSIQMFASPIPRAPACDSDARKSLGRVPPLPVAARAPASADRVGSGPTKTTTPREVASQAGFER
jgi:hypothetical protein